MVRMHPGYQSSGSGSALCVTAGCCSGISLLALGWLYLLLASWCMGDLLLKACLWDRREGASLVLVSLSLRDSLECSWPEKPAQIGLRTKSRPPVSFSRPPTSRQRQRSILARSNPVSLP